MMISPLYKRAAEALNCVRYISGFPFLARESSHQAIIRFNKASFMSLCFAPPPSPLVLSSQRDAQVPWREPQKAFGHQPSTQTAQVPGGGRGHQRGPQSFPLSWGHQQRIHRGANTADHRLLWISALECEPQEWVQQCFTIVYTWACYLFWHGRTYCDGYGSWSSVFALLVRAVRPFFSSLDTYWSSDCIRSIASMVKTC